MTEFTLGAVVGGVVTVLIGAFLLGLWRRRWELWPFAMSITDHGVNPLDTAGVVRLSFGQQKLYFIVAPRQNQDFQIFNGGFVRGKFSLQSWKSDLKRFDFVESNTVRINNINHADRPEFPPYETTTYKKEAMVDLQFDKPFYRSAGENLFVTINYTCILPWSGFLQFEAYNASGNRRRVRCRVRT